MEGTRIRTIYEVRKSSAIWEKPVAEFSTKEAAQDYIKRNKLEGYEVSQSMQMKLW